MEYSRLGVQQNNTKKKRSRRHKTFLCLVAGIILLGLLTCAGMTLESILKEKDITDQIMEKVENRITQRFNATKMAFKCDTMMSNCSYMTDEDETGNCTTIIPLKKVRYQLLL